ncbi:MAG: hypothetical protein ACI86X_002245 [Moritella sp.]|jgi:hypothetical protein
MPHFCPLFIPGGLATSRLRLEEAGLSTFKSSDNLMGSRLVKIFVHTAMLALLAAMAILSIYKETKCQRLKHIFC